MRIKFLSVIVSFLFVSFVISSCLGSNDEVEYSPDATIHAFSIDTIYGKTYKFTINQIKGEIYNEDSLPVWADTIIDRILIKTLSVDGLVTTKDAQGNDSLFNIADSMDLRKPIKIEVWAPDGVQTKNYNIRVLVHQQDPDSLNWGASKGEALKPIKTGFSEGKISGKQKSVLLNIADGATVTKNLIVYSIVNSQIIGYKTPIHTNDPKKVASGTAWTALGTITGLPASVDLSSILSFENKVYAVAADSVYYSADGAAWELHPSLNLYPVTALLVAYPYINNGNLHNIIGICGIVKNESTNTFAMTDRNATSWTLGSEVPADFPTYNLSACTYTSSTGVLGAMLVGSTTPDMSEPRTSTTPWGVKNGTNWMAYTTPTYACPAFSFPSIMYYNGQLVTFGNDFSFFFYSPTGQTWYSMANTKFFFPQGMTNRKGGFYSAVVDENNYIWITCSNNEADSDSKTTGTDDLWRARLNKFSFASYTAK